MRRVLLLVVLTACGRVNFDEARGDGGGAGDDGGTLHSGRPNITILGVNGGLAHTMFDSWITATAQNRMSITGTTTIDDATLATADLVILLDPQKTYSAAESAAIANVVARGGGLLAVTGFGPAFDRDLFNGALNAFGAQALDTPNSNTPVTALTGHPIAAGITSLPYMGGFALASTVSDMKTVVARNSTGAVTALAFDLQAGRVALWGDDWITYDMTWDADTLRFWDNAFAWVWPTQ